MDEKYVRGMFSSLYMSYYESYPSIRKMVKNALRKDLGVATTKPNKVATPSSVSCPEIVKHPVSDDCSSPPVSGTSIIGSRYQKQLGGDFLVALRLVDNLVGVDDINQSNGNASDSDDVSVASNDYTVLGGIGIRKCTNVELTLFLKQQHEQLLSYKSTTTGSRPVANSPDKRSDDCEKKKIHLYELQRLFVDSDTRGMGVGSSLLRAVSDLVVSRVLGKHYRNHRSTNKLACSECIIYVLATTPSLLHTANSFYTSKHQFTLLKEEIVSAGNSDGGSTVLNDLVLRTFYKRIYPCQLKEVEGI
jgi:ribosomal protein S18 acetylase RimI-like enzyme